MSAPRYAALVAALLARRTGEPPPPDPEDRALAVTRMEAAMRARARRRTRVRLALLGAAAAALTLWALAPSGEQPAAPLLTLARPLGRGAVVVSPAGAELALLEPRPLERGARLLAKSGGRALVELSSGTRIALDAGADLRVDGAPELEQFALAAGVVRAEVTPLAPGRRFLLTTLDAEVEVHGTSFSVAVVEPDPRCAEAPRTRVEVFAGVVAVRHLGQEIRLGPAQSWPAPCSPPEPAEVAQSPAPTPPAEPPARHTRAAPPRASRLAEQNDRYARALEHQRDGQLDAALRELEGLRADFPDGPLAESAALLELRLLTPLDPALARAAARRYLTRYPAGAGRSEAEALLTP